MARMRVHLTFPKDLVDQPLIYHLGKNFNVVTNIRRAEVTENQGWVALELEGTQEDIDAGIRYMEEKGVRVDPVPGEVME